MSTPFTTWQLNVLRGVLTISGTLSIVGSTLLSYHALMTGKSKASALHRLLLGLSISDILSSTVAMVFSLAFWPFNGPSPACTARGFLGLLASAGPFYTSALSFYYLLTIKHNVRTERMTSIYEPIFHGVCILYPVTTAIIGLPLQVYNPTSDGLLCLVEPYPLDCTSDEDIECERGEWADVYGAIVLLAFFFVVLVSLIVNNSLLYCFVRKLEKRNNNHAFPGSKKKFKASSNCSSSVDGSKSIQYAASESSAESDEEEEDETRRFCCCGPQRRSTQAPKMSQKVASQCFLYVASFFLTFTPSIILAFLDIGSMETDTLFIWVVVEAILFPAQGTFNYLIYLKPHYDGWRYYGKVSRRQAFLKAAFSKENPIDFGRRRKNTPAASRSDDRSGNSNDVLQNQPNATLVAGRESSGVSALSASLVAMPCQSDIMPDGSSSSSDEVEASKERAS